MDALLRTAVLALAAVFGACVLFLLAHGVGLQIRRRRVHGALRQGRRALSVLLLDPDGGETEYVALRRLPPSVRIRLLTELSRSVGGATREDLAAVARELGVVDRIRAQLGSRRWWRRLQAARMLQAVDPRAHPVLPLLRDPHPAVRAQAAEWAGEIPTGEVARALLEMLGRADALARFSVQDSLLRMGPVAVEPLARYLAERAGWEVLPALDVAVALAQPVFVAPAISLCSDAVPEVRVRAAELLGAVGGQEGTDALAALLQDPVAEVRAAAARALGRVRHWPSAFGVAQLLRDSSWEVRHAAGLALRAMGSPGELMLRRFRDDTDRFAADMARQVLELPRDSEGR